MKKCGNCVHFWVKRDEVELAQHAPHISECQPGKPHCLGGQVRGACDLWQVRMEKGLPMPWADGPMVESTFVCPLWEKGGPSVKMVGSYNKEKKADMKANAAIVLGIVAPFLLGKAGNRNILSGYVRVFIGEGPYYGLTAIVDKEEDFKYFLKKHLGGSDAYRNHQAEKLMGTNNVLPRHDL